MGEANNFHNAGPINLIIDPFNIVRWNGDKLYLLSKAQASRIEKHFCGISDCCCGSGPMIVVDRDEYAIHPSSIDQE